MGIYRNFDIFHSLLDLSLVFLSERETISEISIKASKFTTPRALSINKQCIPYILQATTLTMTLRVILDNKPSAIQLI